MTAISPQRQWALALSAIVTEMNAAHHDELGGWRRGEETASSWCKDVLRDSYDVEDASSFVALVRWLSTEGHSAEARATLAELGGAPEDDTPRQRIARAHRALIERSGLFAWDAGRLVAAAGWGYWAGFVAEEEAWGLVLDTALRVQSAYDSWRAYAGAYMIGRLYWSGGARHARTEAAYTKLLVEPASPWNRLPWSLDLHGTGARPIAAAAAMLEPTMRAAAKVRFKRSVCPSCGSPKTRASPTAYVYCDYCSALSDFDLEKLASVRPAERAHADYEGLVQTLAPLIAQAKSRSDVPSYRQLQRRIFDAFVTASRATCPPRVTDPTYRHAYVTYMAEGATVAAFDPMAEQHEAAVNHAVRGLHFVSPRPGVVKLSPPSFHVLEGALFAQHDHLARLHEHHGIYAMHPDHATTELKQRIGFALSIYGWLPMLDEAIATPLLARARLRGDYVEMDPPMATRIGCPSCGGALEVLAGARRVICDGCGHAVDVEHAGRGSGRP